MSRALTAKTDKEMGYGAASPQLKSDTRYWRPSTLDTALDSTQARRMHQIRQYGGFTLAYSTAVQPGISYFESHGGYIAYMKKWGYIHVLGDPVVAPEWRGELLGAFVDEFPKAGFYQVSRETASELAKCKYYINEMGVDTRIDLPNYTFDGKSKEFLRYAGNWLQRRGYRIEERSLDDGTRQELSELTSRWMRTRRVKSEVRFLNRPLSLENEPDVRRFFLIDHHDRVVALVFFDPLYESGRIIGYATSFKRRDTESTNGYAEPGIMRTALAVFQREGKSEVRLGLAPLANIENNELRRNWFLHHSFRYFFKSWWVNRYFYNLRGHAAFKKRFCGIEEKTYFASRSLSNDLRIAGMLRLCGIL